MLLCKWAVDSVKNLWRWIFPKKVEIDDCLKKWLEHVFPGLNLDRVRFYEGLPPFIKVSNPNAITLPAIWGGSKINIYFRYGPDYCSCNGLELIAHEMVHARQYMDYAGGYGLGFARLFMMPYLMCFTRHGYRNSPLEVEAYDFDARISACCSPDRLPCDCSVTPPVDHITGFGNWMSHCGNITMNETSISFFDHIWNCLPGLESLWNWGNRVWRYCGIFFRNRVDEANRTTDPDFNDLEGIRFWEARLARLIFVAWAQSVFVCIGTSILAILTWIVSIIYFVLATVILLAVILAIAIIWAIFNILAVLATVVWAIIAGILCIFDAIWWVLKKIWE